MTRVDINDNNQSSNKCNINNLQIDEKDSKNKEVKHLEGFGIDVIEFLIPTTNEDQTNDEME
jgi:hypothetical protein